MFGKLIEESHTYSLSIETDSWTRSEKPPFPPPTPPPPERIVKAEPSLPGKPIPKPPPPPRRPEPGEREK